VPMRETMEIFNKAMIHLSDLAIKRKIIVVATYIPHVRSRRRVFLESVLFGRAGTVIRMAESKDRLQFTLERHSLLKSFTMDILSDAVTLEKFVEA